MYLACCDEVINQKQKELKDKINEIIEINEAIPFWRFWEKESDDDMRSFIIGSWSKFGRWTNQRIREQERLDRTK